MNKQEAHGSIFLLKPVISLKHHSEFIELICLASVAYEFNFTRDQKLQNKLVFLKRIQEPVVTNIFNLSGTQKTWSRYKQNPTNPIFLL
jgi:hypothetical protein